MSRASRVSRNFAWLSSARFFSQLCLFASSVYLTRVLEVHAFGIMVFAGAIFAYAQMGVDFGISSLGPREVARDKIPLRSLVQTVVAIRLIIMIAGFGAMALFIWVAPITSLGKTVIFLYSLSLITYALDLTWVFYGKEIMRIAGMAEAFSHLVLLALTLGFVREPGHVVWIPIYFFASRSTLVLWLLITYFKRFGSFVPRLDYGLARKLVRDAAPLWGSAVIGALIAHFGITVIGLTTDEQHTGHYGAALRLGWAPSLLISAYFTTLWPSLHRGYVEGLVTIEGLLGKSIRLTSGLGIGLAVGGFMVAEPLLAFLFGDPYRDAAIPLAILLVGAGVGIVSRHYRFLLVSFNHQDIYFRVMAISAVALVVSSLVFIPLMGASGAALGTLVGELAIFIAGYAYVRKLIGYVPIARYLLRPAASAAVMAGVLFLVRSLHVGLQVAIGGSCYIALLLILRVVEIDEVRIILKGWLPARWNKSRQNPEPGDH